MNGIYNFWKRLSLVFITFLPVCVLLFARQYFPSHYSIASAYKLVYAAPLLVHYVEQNSLKMALVSWYHTMFHPYVFRDNIVRLTGIGMLVALVYIASYAMFGNSFDTSAIVLNLAERISLTGENLVAIGLYIILVNSLLEEFFWRGYIFRRASLMFPRWLAYSVSAVGFTSYHVVYIAYWFPWYLTVLAGLALVIFGGIMNLVYERTNDVFSCWYVHAFADIAQILIAAHIFGFFV